MKTRAGSISKVPSGYRVRLPRELGRRSLGIFSTEKQAQQMLRAALIEMDASPIRAGVTLNEWAEEWFQRRDASGHYRRTDTERARWKTYIQNSDLGEIPIAELMESEVRRWLHNLRGKNGQRLAGQTLQNTLNILRACLADARDHGICDENVSKNVRLPKGAHAKTGEGWTWLRIDEISALLGSELRPADRAIFTVAIYSGLRAGELWGLHWDDVDFDRGSIYVRHSYLGPTKNGQAREVPMLATVRHALETWQAEAAEADKWRQRRKPPKTPRVDLGLVFPARNGRCHVVGYDADLSDRLRDIGITRRVRFHDLRHSCASHLLQGSWAPELLHRALRIEEVRDWLGHSDITITQRYAHLCADGIRAVVGTGPGHKPEPETPKISARGKIRTSDLRFRKPLKEPQKPAEKAQNTVPNSSAVSRLAMSYLEAVSEGRPNREKIAVQLAESVLLSGKATPERRAGKSISPGRKREVRP